jgi:CRISPR-associated endonuclease/helicase Cas3
MKDLNSAAVAHYSKRGEKQDVYLHLSNVAALSRSSADKIGLGAAGELTGLLHDLGKHSAEFQNYLGSAAGLLDQDHDEGYIDPEKAKGKIDHSTAGAQTIWRALSGPELSQKVAGEILALCVASHHSGLIDCLGADGSDLLTRRMCKPDSLSHYEESQAKVDEAVLSRYQELIRSRDLTSGIRTKIQEICAHRESETVLRFKIGLLTRFLLSCLVDADHTDTADFENPVAAQQRLNGKYVDWPALIQRLEETLARFSCRNRIDELRSKISAYCLCAAEREPGIFSLTVPTGGGKTLASLRFALHHAALHGMDRIIFVIPFTSIIDQNAEEVRKILEGPETGASAGSIVLEHHSNLTPARQTWRNKILSENWDAPIVFTTSVQFMEALFGAGTRSARRMHQLANSVIVFDEIQTLPVRCVHLFNNALNFLAETCRSTIVLCTATQPLLHKVDERKGVLHLGHNAEIVPDTRELFAQLSRVKVSDQRKPGGWTSDEIARLALEEVGKAGSCLIVVNTKAAAVEIFRLAQAMDSGVSLFHLSTNMCPAHRKARLAEIRRLLEPDSMRPLLCVSTQLIEAGVDVDFGSVIRLTAGLDSIAQAAGRCNRHGRRQTGTVHVVNPAVDKTEKLPDIMIGKNTAERVLDEIANGALAHDILSPATMERYFHYYFFERRNEMSYPVKAGSYGFERDDTLLNLLSENSLAANGKALPNYLRQSFMTAAQAFQAIDAPSQGVVVPYKRLDSDAPDDGEAVIGELCAAFEVEKQIYLLERAQQFTVNVFPNVLQRLQEQNAVFEAQETGILCLNPQYYDKEFGLSETPVNPMEVPIG